MKKIKLLIIFMLINIGLINAQTGQGKMLLGASSNLGLSLSGSDFINIGYSSIRNKGDADDFEEYDPKKGQRHIDDIEPSKIAGFFNDDGYEINTDLIKKPGLCIICIHNNDLNEEILCNMTRYDQMNDKDFKCFAYKRRKKM